MAILPPPRVRLRRYGVLFVVGAPRSGTTVLTQALIHGCVVESFTNTHAALYGAPWVVEALFGPWPPWPPAVFTSRRGRTPGLMGAHEGARFHYRFFPRDPQAVPPGSVDARAIQSFRRNVRAIGGLARRCVVIKNVANSVRLAVVARALPEALFLVIRRNEDDVVRSIVSARRAESGNEAEWFSVRPEDWEVVRDREPATQARWQARAVYASIAKARFRWPGRFHDVDYEVFCRQPGTVLAEVCAWARRHGCRIRRRPGVDHASAILHRPGVKE